MSFFSEAMNDASRIVSSVLGEDCIYIDYLKNQSEIKIIINRNVEVKNDFNILVGYRVEAVIQKSDVPNFRVHDTFIDESDQKWRINMLTKQTSAVLHVDIVGID